MYLLVLDTKLVSNFKYDYLFWLPLPNTKFGTFSITKQVPKYFLNEIIIMIAMLVCSVTLNTDL